MNIFSLMVNPWGEVDGLCIAVNNGVCKEDYESQGWMVPSFYCHYG